MRITKIPAGERAKLHWWGALFLRVWRDREQMVLVLRVPCWRVRERLEQLCVSWRAGEGWRKGWRIP